MTNITAPHFTDEDKAREHLETLRWPEGPFCPHCGSVNATRLPAQRGRPTKAHPEGKVRKGVVQCNDCRQQYSVTVGTVFESSKVPLHKWLLANHLLCASKKGMSAHQLHRMLGITYKTAWFMFHRIREAMRSDDASPMGGTGGMVEVDETYIGRQKGKEVRTGGGHKMKVLALVDRESAKVRSFTDPDLTAKDIHPIIRENIAKEARLMTDEARLYWNIGKEFAAHNRVLHAGGEYVRKGDATIHTNTVEGFFSIFKRGMRGIYQHCGEQHLHRYLAEFDFRYTNRSANGVEDDMRADLALKNIAGRRVTYRRADSLYA
ncbi:MAG TPA: IS1595 family transposase [Novosphingobium sp.]|nr:IS1595 family transposase [Novosphingobium sp.]